MSRDFWKFEKFRFELDSGKELPASIFKLTDLSYLDLTGCSKITKFPEASVFLKYLYLSETAIEEVPQSIQFLTGLVTLKLTNNKKLLSLSSSICKLKCLKTLDLSGCSKFECFPEILEPMEVLATLRVSQTAIKYFPSPIENVKFLETLHLNECKNLVSLPSNIHQLSRLEEIDLTYCKGLLSLPKLPSSLILLKANNCESLENLSSRSKCNFECIHFANCFKLDLKADAHLAIQLIASKLPSHRHQLKGIAFCIVIALEGSQSLPDIIFPIACWINCECRVKADNFEGNAVIGLPELIHMLHCNIKKCGVRLLYVEANSKPSSMFDSDTEEEESNSKRIKYSND
ncbi:hypothetical protein GH714_019556 [Hevea brasiliensis]|uniref:Disease resistance protein RPS4B/Roq1-like leucine-rich repeats domain-containing protein n=1 Tax=Hevea brasiliensis TaxID=3981 RepID=A0A6A6LC73_HEVBR|nr:hypothetical protein GH714_019556 [Hevea brasiliensis]